MSYSAIQAGGRRRKQGHLELWYLFSKCFQVFSNHYGDEALLSWRWMNICLPMGSSE